MNITIIGSGTWGCAIAILLADKGYNVKIWAHSSEAAKELAKTRRLPQLPGAELQKSIEITDDMENAAKDAELLVMAVASPYVRSTSAKLCPFVKKGGIIVNLAKGIEEDTFAFPDRQIREEIPFANVAVLSGPSHAEEVSRFIPTTCVVGADDEKTADYLQDIFMTDDFRVYTGNDIIGMELGASLKNVIALAAGMSDGLGCGDNLRAALITRGLAEINRLGKAMGAKPETVYGLTGLGDLIVTCASMHSRNRRAGIYIGQGKTLKEAIELVGMAVEGVNCAKAAKALSEKYDVEMPIVKKVNEILFENLSPALAIKELMGREKKSEQ